jgi:hypothetical protein
MMMKKFLFLSVLNINCISDNCLKYDKFDEKYRAHSGPYGKFTMITATGSVFYNQTLEFIIGCMKVEKYQ